VDFGLKEPLPHNASTNAEADGYGILGLARGIFVDKIIRIERNAFHGIVYNLQTECGSYIANNIITHNCHCNVVPWTEGISMHYTSAMGDSGE
jgi:hypothetical protein